MLHSIFRASSACVACLLTVATACGGTVSSQEDLRPDASDVFEVTDVEGPDLSINETDSPDDQRDLWVDSVQDAEDRPTCCTEAICAQLLSICDPATCLCRPGTNCCTEELCAAAGMACDTDTCRCARVPCQLEGVRCDDSLVPGDFGRLVCTATSVGLVCLRRVTGWTGCGSSVCGAWDDKGCTCGWVGCTTFEDICGPGQNCLIGSYAPMTSGACGVAGTLREGEVCNGPESCAPGLACQSVCVRVECGLAPGAPGCPVGLTCRPLDPWGLLGTCRVPCDPYDPAGPCGSGEWCRGPCAYLEPAPFCQTATAATYGLLGGWCSASQDVSPAGANQACEVAPCAPGLLCAAGVCLEACPAGLSAGDVRDQAACSPGLECAPVQANWPISTPGGACATPCDPFALDPDAVCEANRFCTMSAFATPSLAHCLPMPWPMAGPGAYCSPWGLPCQAGYSCAASGPGRDYICQPACVPGVDAGAPGSCPVGQRCFRYYDLIANALAPWGACATPCDPFAAGEASGCAANEVCEPRERDLVTGRLAGQCFYRDSGAEGQPCKSAEPGVHPGCAPGLVCRPEGSDSRCRPQCDVQWRRTGQGACPEGQECKGAWPPVGDPFMAGCVTK